jgi:phosphotransferase system enzyme I (PtsI)
LPLKRGIPVSPGYCIGKAYIFETEEPEKRIPKRSVPAEQVAHEREVIVHAFEGAIAEIDADVAQASSRVGGDEVADILRTHKGFMSAKMRDEILELIDVSRYSAAYAIQLVLLRYQRKFESVPFLQERVRDLIDIKTRLLRHAAGEARKELEGLDEPVIIVAHDLTPSQTAMLDRRSHVLGFATDLGGSTSHTAIVARGLGIPAVVGLDNITTAVTPGDMLVLDGTHGVVIIDPDESQLTEYREQAARRFAMIKTLDELRDLPAETRDGVGVELHGNIEFPDEVAKCLEKGATGIGLFRSEFLFLENDTEPSEEEQFQVYRRVVEELNGKPLIIRTVDLGADKYTRSRVWDTEPNPFLGLRSIRYCLRHRDIFWPQLRAILRAAIHGPRGSVKIMFPLVSRVMELRQAAYMLRMAMEELEEEGFEVPTDIPVGVMVETPSAAICAESFAAECSFMSIGTNDLVQYALAVDRTNERVASLYTPYDPSVVRLLDMVIRAGIEKKVEVSICGELAGDAMATILLLGLGLRRLSMSAGQIPEIKKLIRSITMEDAERVANRVRTFETEREVLNYLRDETRRVAPDSV